MTLRHLRIFVTVADEKTMHAAAKKLFISQPSISQAIAELEEHYHVRLFERLSKRLYITETGEKLLPYARHLVGSFDQLEDMMIEHGQKHSLRIGASVSVGTCMINDIILELHKISPDTEVFVTINNTSLIEEMILQNQLDAALVEGVINSTDLYHEDICEDELLVISYPEHPLAKRKHIKAVELTGMDFIAREAGSNDRNQFEQFFNEMNITVNKKWSSSNTQAIKNGVEHKNGLAILSKMLVNDELKDGTLQALNIDDAHITRKIKLIYHKDKYIFDDLMQFCNIVRNFSRD